MEISRIASPVQPAPDYMGSTHGSSGIGTVGFSEALDRAAENLDRQKPNDSYKIFIRSGQTPELDKYQEDWMRPLENFML